MNTLETQRLAFLGPRKVAGQKSQDFLIMDLDPLGFDSHLHKIPLFNKSADVNGLAELLYSIIPYPDDIWRYDYDQAVAAVRDIGFFLGSIKKQGAEPLEIIPELEYVLDELSQKTDLPPRDTLLHYTVWNPDGSRMRTYTSHKDEVELINSVKTSSYPLLNAIQLLIELHETDFESSRFEALCLEAAEEFEFVIDSIVHARRTISPEIFAKELRLYFEPIRIYKDDVIGPGAVEMPMFVFDHLLWSSDCTDVSYNEFKIGFLPFILPYLRDIYYNYDGKPSLVSRLCDHIPNAKNVTATMRSSKALLKLCNLQKSFRMPHKRLAEEAYAHEEKDLKEKGSGGYSPTILKDILDLNLKQIKNLSDRIKILTATELWFE